MKELDILTSVFLKILKGGNIVRITEKSTSEQKVGILVNIDTVKNKAILKSNSNNSLGELFINTYTNDEIIDLRNYFLTMITKKEFQNFKKIMQETIDRETNQIVKEFYKKILYRVDENIANTTIIQNNILKIGYKLFPEKKIEIFNKLMKSNLYEYKEENIDINNILIDMNKRRKSRNKHKMKV